jgi:hypothetical protein
MTTIIKTIYLTAIIVSLSGCKKEALNSSNNNKSMQQIYYTVEGKPYTLKAITKFTDGVLITIPSANFPLRVPVNIPGISAPQPSYQAFAPILETDRKIVPLMFSLGVWNSTLATQFFNIASPYYFSELEGGQIESAYLKPLAKSSVMVEPITSVITNDDYVYNIRYSQIVLSEKDFLEPSNGRNLFFCQNLSQALAVRPAFINVVNGTYRIGVTFLYFEMQ